MAYSLPRDVFLLLESAFNQDRDKAEIFAKAIESSIQAIDEKANENKQVVKAELYNELRNELATKEFVRAEIAEIRAEIAELHAEVKQISLQLKILTGIAIFGLTLFNPAFVRLVELMMK